MTSSELFYKRFIKTLCWIPVVGIIAELYHVYCWEPYLSNNDHVGRWLVSVIWQGTITFIIFRFLILL